MTTGEISFTPREVEKLLAACNNIEDEVMVRLAVTTGIRRYDISHIKVANIGIQNDSMAWLHYTEKKKGDRNRSIPLQPDVTIKIKQHINALGRVGIAKQKGYLFSWGKSRWGDKTAWYRLQDLCRRAEIPERPFHAFRATAIKMMQRAGYTIEEISSITGDTIDVIQRHYSTPTLQELEEAVRTKTVIQ